MFMLTALIVIPAFYTILALVLVLLVRGGDRAVGHARSRRRGNWFLEPAA